MGWVPPEGAPSVPQPVQTRWPSSGSGKAGCCSGWTGSFEKTGEIQFSLAHWFLRLKQCSELVHPYNKGLLQVTRRVTK